MATLSLLPVHGALRLHVKKPQGFKSGQAVAISALRLPAGGRGGTQLRHLTYGQMVTEHGRVDSKKHKTIHAALSLAPCPLYDVEERNRLCEEYGFTQIGEPVPSNISMKNTIDTLPREVFEMDDIKAWKSAAISVAAYTLGLYLISKAPWYLLPSAWAWTGTAVNGFFVIGHDRAHKSFSKNKLVEDIVGTLAFLPLIYPYEPWRFKHDTHHAKTNMFAT